MLNIVSYLLDYEFWIEAILQNLIVIVAMVESVAIINHARGYPVQYFFPIPRSQHFEGKPYQWALSFFAIASVLSAFMISMTESWMLHEPFQFYTFDFISNSIGFGIFGVVAILGVTRLNADKTMNIEMVILAIILGFGLSFWQDGGDFVSIRQAIGISLGAGIFFPTLNWGSRQPKNVKFVYYLMMTIVISLMIYHFVYAPCLVHNEC